jgi:2-polyprenyl-3-methyl-5-hydroxy-6-metoxy-1,4-benzoquinol methylase
MVLHDFRKISWRLTFNLAILHTMTSYNLKEDQIRPAQLMKQKEWAVEADRNFLQQRRGQFVDVNCPACGQSCKNSWAIKDLFTYVECIDCGTIYTSPRPGPELLEQFYRQSQNYSVWSSLIFPATEEMRKEKIFVPRAQRTVDLCRSHGTKGGTLIEIGAAFGTFCAAIREQDFFDKIVAVEPTPSLARTCRERGFETYEQTIENLSFPPAAADVVTAFEVIEHLFSPMDFVQRACQLLKPGGLIICSCPSAEGIGMLVLREQARVVDHEHVNYFTPSSVEVLLARCGVDVVEVSTPGEMDLDLLKNQLVEKPNYRCNCPVIRKLLEQLDDKSLVVFQDLLKKARLSSHMWLVGRKKTL